MKLLIMILYAVEDLKANSEYTGYTAASTVVQWFWEVVKGFSKEDMARFLQFVTGTSKVSGYHYHIHYWYLLLLDVHFFISRGFFPSHIESAKR